MEEQRNSQVKIAGGLVQALNLVHVPHLHSKKIERDAFLIDKTMFEKSQDHKIPNSFPLKNI